MRSYFSLNTQETVVLLCKIASLVVRFLFEPIQLKTTVPLEMSRTNKKSLGTPVTYPVAPFSP